jgi:O-antigen/teichoic acid export membrane protein
MRDSASVPPARRHGLLAAQMHAREAAGFALLFYSAQAINYLHLLAMMWLMEARDYGAFAAIMGATYISAAVAVAFQTTVAALVADSATVATPCGRGSRYLAAPALFGAITGIVILAASPFLTASLSLSTADVIIMAMASVLAQPLGVAYGVLQGQGRFLRLGSLQVIGAVARLVSGIGLVAAGFGPAGGAAGVVVGYLLVLSLTTREIASTSAGPYDAGFSRLAQNMGIGLLATIAASAPTAVDPLLARHLLAPDDSGIYASVVNLARLGIFLSLPVSQLLIPQVASLAARGLSTSWRLLSAMALASATAAAGGAAGSTLAVLLHLLRQIMDTSAPHAWYAAAIAAPASAIACCAYLWVARGACRLEGLLLAASPMALVAALLLHHDSAAAALTAAAAGLAVFSCLVAAVEMLHAHGCPGRRTSGHATLPPSQHIFLQHRLSTGRTGISWSDLSWCQQNDVGCFRSGRTG